VVIFPAEAHHHHRDIAEQFVIVILDFAVLKGGMQREIPVLKIRGKCCHLG
jgi:hypothetical protein